MVWPEFITEQTRSVLTAAVAESRARGGRSCHAQDLLVGVLRCESPASRVLLDFGVTDATLELVRSVDTSDISTAPAFAPDAKRILGLAVEEVARLGDHRIDVHHLVFAMLTDRLGPVRTILERFESQPDGDLFLAVTLACVPGAEFVSAPVQHRSE